MVELIHLAAILIALGATFALAVQNLSIRMGTETGRVTDAVLVVLVVNLVVLVPLVLLVYYPDYGLTRRSWLSFIAAGVIGTLFGRLFTFMSIDRIGASRTSPIVATWALVGTVLGVVVLDESLSAIHAVGVVLVVGGVAAIAWETSHENPDDLSRRELLIGLVIPFLAASFFGIEPVFAKFGLEEGTPATVGVAIKLVVATAGFGLYLWWRDALPGRRIWSSNLRWFGLAGISGALYLLGYYLSLELAPVSIVAPIITTNTLIIVILSRIFMPNKLERVTWKLAAAATVVVVGVLTITVYG